MEHHLLFEKFQARGTFLRSLPFGSGHINDTYRVRTDVNIDYILQRINHFVFKNPQLVMDNHVAAGHYLEEQGLPLIVNPVRTRDNTYLTGDFETGFWRVFPFLSDYESFETLHNTEVAYQCALAFGKFGQALSGMDTGLVGDTIPGFHDTPGRYRTYLESLGKDVQKRSANCQPEIDTIARFEYLINEHLQLRNSLEKRIIHNDTKVNNVMLNKSNAEDFRIIDLDTMMPDYVIFDYGDMIRTGVCDAAEDEHDLDSIFIRLDYFEAITRGFLKGYGHTLTADERALLFTGAQIIIYEQAIRFLNDYLLGDPYYKTSYDEHNLVRTRTQLRLLQEMDFNEKILKKIQAEVQLFI